MDFRKSISKPFKKLKDKLPGSSHKRDGRSRSKDGGKRREADIKGGEVSRRNSYPRSGASVDGTMEGGPGTEGSDGGGGNVVLVNVNPPTSAPSVLHIWEPDSTRMMSFSVLPLTGPADNADSSAVPDQVPVLADESKFKRWGSTASATAKLLLRGVKESADAFPPLKSVVGGLCFILDNCEV